jgi:RNA polymerase sigma-70 factor (ECF subfamily)
LCGFGIDEIADAFLSNKETINKRLFRAKEKLREEKIRMELPPSDQIESRLQTVLTTLYLLFNEGYYSASQNNMLRKDFCLEAMRLNLMLTQNTFTNKPFTNALLALMCFHASRFEARLKKSGEVILYEEQDTNLWNNELIQQGEYFLNVSAHGNQLTKYHLEAAIAYWHTKKTDSKEKWEAILKLYNKLLQIEYSPAAALNRTYALAKVYGSAKAIHEAEKLKLENNHLYYSLLAELYISIDKQKAIEHLAKSITKAKTESAKQLLNKKMLSLQNL